MSPRASIPGISAWLVLAAVPLLVGNLGCSRVAPAYTDDGGSEGSPVLDPYPYATAGWSSEESTSADTDTDTETDTQGMIPDEPVDVSCDLVVGQGCTGDDKCVPIPWDCCGLFECVPVLGDKLAGESCFNEGQGSNLDDCDANSYCLYGVCRAFCDAQGTCGPDSQCLVNGPNGPNWVCIGPCDPLVQDCPLGQGCFYDPSYGFACGELGDGAGLGEPCVGSSINECLPGLGCVPEFDYPDGCGGAPGCCTNLCDPELGGAACADGPPGTSCTEFGLPLAPGVGVCSGSGLVAGDLQIVEIYADPPGITIVEAPLEFVEILNMSDKQINLGPLSFGDFINQSSEGILENYTVVAGDGGCAQFSELCLAPGRRVLFVNNAYVGEIGNALVLGSQTGQLVNALLQPFTRLKVYDSDLVITSHRADNNLDFPIAPEATSMHRIDLAGPDLPNNWASGPISPGL